MKKTINFKKIFIIAISIFAVFSFAGCEKESVFPTKLSVKDLSPELQNIYAQMPERNFGKISIIGDGILRFTDDEQLDSVYHWLKINCELWDDLFIELCNNLHFTSNEQIEEFENKSNYDPLIPLKEFEKAYKIEGKNLRSKQEKEIDKWKKNGEIGEFPYDSFSIDEIEQTLYSSYYEICVGDTIAQYRLDGSIVLVPITLIDEIPNIRNQTIQNIVNEGRLKVKNFQKSSETYDDHKVLPILNKRGSIFISSYAKSDWVFNSRPKNCFFSDKIKVKSTIKLTNYHLKNGKWKTVRRSCAIASSLSFHYVELVSSYTNPPVSYYYHNTNNYLYGNTLPLEKKKYNRTDSYTHPHKFPQSCSEIGLGLNSKFNCTIEFANKSASIF